MITESLSRKATVSVPGIGLGEDGQQSGRRRRAWIAGSPLLTSSVPASGSSSAIKLVEERSKGATPKTELIEAVWRSVVAVSLGDDWGSIRADDRPGFLGWLTGVRRPNRLADPRLEAVRRYAVSYRLAGGVIDPDEESACLDLGVSEGTLRQVEAVLRPAISPGGTNHRFRLVLAIAAAALLFVLVTIWLNSILGDLMISGIVAGAGAALLAGLTSGGRSGSSTDARRR